MNPTKPENTPAPNDSRHAYLLLDRFKKEAIARIYALPSTIYMLNSPQWMKSRGWEYVLEDTSDIKFKI